MVLKETYCDKRIELLLRVQHDLSKDSFSVDLIYFLTEILEDVGSINFLM